LGDSIQFHPKGNTVLSLNNKSLKGIYIVIAAQKKTEDLAIESKES